MCYLPVRVVGVPNGAAGVVLLPPNAEVAAVLEVFAPNTDPVLPAPKAGVLVAGDPNTPEPTAFVVLTDPAPNEDVCPNSPPDGAAEPQKIFISIGVITAIRVFAFTTCRIK